MNTKLYVLEGPDGVGKSTLATQLQRHLRQNGCKSELFSFPGNEPGTVGNHIYGLYHNPNSFGVQRISTICQQLLMVAAHADVIQRIIPALEQDLHVILDRFWWSTWVYSSFARIDINIRELLIKLELVLWRSYLPNCIFLIRRNRPSNSEHCIDSWRKLVLLYNEIAKLEQHRSKVIHIDNNGTLEESISHMVREIT